MSEADTGRGEVTHEAILRAMGDDGLIRRTPEGPVETTIIPVGKNLSEALRPR